MQVKTESFDGMLTVQNWLDAGYKKYYGNHLNNADFLLQKRFDDEVGKKYFIDIWVYEHSKHSYYEANQNIPAVSFQPEVQFRRDPDITMNVTFILNQDSTIAEIEQQFECLWLFLEKPYYEKWDE